MQGPHLFVDGERFTLLGAELHNSSSSTLRAIRKSFARVAKLGANTVLSPVAWDLFEPHEGIFDFELVDAMVEEARRHDLRLILLWFGSWKNGMSSYAPGWVKQNPGRFPRAELASKGRIEHLSPFGVESREADARAFGTLMAHLRQIDEPRTVLMVQVENEVGLLGDSRDRSELADRAWNLPVPDSVIDAVRSSPNSAAYQSWKSLGQLSEGTWGQVFGTSPEGEEAFMAYAYASYVEHVAAVGRVEYDIPLFVNAWLDDTQAAAGAMAGGQQPGEYPSGGPLVRVGEIWKVAAPSIDFLAPDIYSGDFQGICEGYIATTGRLFIPEMQRSSTGVAQMLLAVGELGALGVSPFGVDSLTPSDPEWEVLADGYNLLRAAAQSLRCYPNAVCRGFVLSPENSSVELEFSNFTIKIDSDPMGTTPPSAYPAYGLAIEEEPGRVLIAGRGFTAVFGDSTGMRAGILSAEEISADDGHTVNRRFNGDETFSGRLALFPGLAGTSANMPIPISSERTGIVRYTFYRY